MEANVSQKHPQHKQKDCKYFLQRSISATLTIYLKANASKVDGIVADNADKTLDQLVAERKINADQKAQILKKPGLQQQLQQFEEQIAQFKKFDQEYKAASQAEKAEFERTHTERASKDLEEAVASAKAEGAAAAAEAQESNLLLLSQFLRLAAIRRGEDEDPELEENKALEGLLGRVYTGDAAAVSSMLSLINGSDEKIYSVNGDPLTVTCRLLQLCCLTIC
jgi:TolA-binding protein